MTNQASEDELATNIDKIIEYWDFSPLQDEDSRIERVHKEIESLIRTEKLKLLAEVRERVVGEDKPLQGKYRASGLMSYDMTNHYENSLRAEQRAVLTQLEAEL